MVYKDIDGEKGREKGEILDEKGLIQLFHGFLPPKGT